MVSEEFDRILSDYKKIKEQHVDGKRKFYGDRVDSKRFGAQGAGVAILFLGLVIPIVTNLKFTYPASAPWLTKEIIVSIISLVIAFVTGLSTLFQWSSTWKEYSSQIVQIDKLIGLWELEVAHARHISDQEKDISVYLQKATEKLINSVENLVSTEMRTFFRAGERREPGGEAHPGVGPG